MTGIMIFLEGNEKTSWEAFGLVDNIPDSQKAANCR